MKKLSDKIGRAAHIKSNTAGTSNEISFSVLDAKKQSQDGEKQLESVPELPGLGVISLFTLGKVRKTRSTPVKEKGFFLPSGEFVSTEGDSPSIIPASGTSNTPAVIRPTALGESSLALPGVASPVADKAGAAPSAVASLTNSSSKSSSTRKWQTPQDEVARRKKTRKTRKAFAVAALAILVVVGLGVGGATLMQYLEQQQTKRGQLTSFISMVEEADEAVLAFDELVVTQINGGVGAMGVEALASSYADMSDDLDVAREDLERARTLVEQVLIDLTEPTDIEAANQAIVSINARINLIDAGRLLVDEMISGQSAAQAASEGWSLILAGDTAAREAAAMVSKPSAESIQESMERSSAALDAFTQAVEKLSFADSAYEAVDLSAYVSYAQTRVDAQGHALASDQAYLDRNKEILASENDEYNQLDAAAAEMAKSLSGDPGELVEAYSIAQLAVLIDQYSSERSRAGAADAILRDYLGIRDE